MRRYYLDHNATTPVRPEVIERVAETMSLKGNASSVHSEGRKTHSIVEASRETIRQFVNAPVNGLVFTSGGTESIHYALHGAVNAGLVHRIFVSAIEHPAVTENAQTTGVPVEIIPVLKNGCVDLNWLSRRLVHYDGERDGGFLVCVMLANNETGVVQPCAEVAKITHEAGGLVFVDAAQAVGKVPVNFVMLGADMMSFTGHKFGGPLGIGALALRPNLSLDPVLRGGGHEMNRRAGTSNVPVIAGLAKACELAVDTLSRAAQIAHWRDQMQTTVEARGAIVWGGEVTRLPGTLSFSVNGFSAETQLMVLDLEGLAVSSGSACSSGKTKPSHVLAAMGAPDELAQCGMRISLGWNSTQDDVDAFIRIWPQVFARVKNKHKGAA